MHSSNSDRSFTNSLRVIFRGFYPVFIVFATSEDSKQRQILCRLLNYVVFVFLSTVVANDIYLVYKTYSYNPLGIIISALSGDFSSIAIRILLMRNRQYILLAIRQIIILHGILPLKKSENGYVTIAFCGCWIVPCLMYINCIKLLISKHGVQVIQMTTIFGLYWKNALATCLAMFLRFIALTQVYALPSCCVVLCYYSCKLLTDAIKDIERNIKINGEPKELFSSFIVITQKLSKCLKYIEAALSLMLFLLYCYLMSCIFIVITLMIRVWPTESEQDRIINNITKLTMSLLGFYLLSLQAAGVHDSAVKLQRTIYSLYAKFPFATCKRNTGSYVLLLTMADELEKFHITVWGIFPLNRRFILQTTGAMLSYGIIISQLGLRK